MPLWQCSIHRWILGNLAHKMRQGMLGGGSMWEELLIWAVLWRRRSTKRNPFHESHLDLSVHMFLRWQIPRLLVQPTWAKFLQNWKLYWGAKRWGSQYIFAEQNQHGFFGVCVCVCVSGDGEKVRSRWGGRKSGSWLAIASILFTLTVRYVPPIRGSLMRAKKAPKHTNITVLVKLVATDATTTTGKYHVSPSSPG